MDAKEPDDATPEPQLLTLLDALAAMPNVDLAIVSGRPESFLQRWLVQLPMHF